MKKSNSLQTKIEDFEIYRVIADSPILFHEQHRKHACAWNVRRIFISRPWKFSCMEHLITHGPPDYNRMRQCQSDIHNCLLKYIFLLYHFSAEKALRIIVFLNVSLAVSAPKQTENVACTSLRTMS